MASESQNSRVSKVLPWGKIEKYNSSLFKDSWRIGTIADGSCFFHAILTAVDKTYRDMKGDGVRGLAQTEKQQRATMIRSKIGKKLTMKNWQTLQNGEPAHLSLTEQIRHTERICLRSPLLWTASIGFGMGIQGVGSKCKSYLYSRRFFRLEGTP